MDSSFSGSIFADRLNLLLEQNNLKQVDLIKLAEQKGATIGKSRLSQYISGKTVPRRGVIELFADIFGVDPDWLAGTKDDPEVQEATGTVQSPGKRTFSKSAKLDNVLYDVRGPVVDTAAVMESQGTHVLKLNIGNPAPFGFRTPDEVIYDMRMQLTDCEGYSDSKGLFSARKAIMQYSQLKNVPNVAIEDVYTGNGVSELINLSMQALLDSGDEVLIPAPDYPLWTA